MSFSEWREIKLGDLVEVSSSKRIYAKEYVDSGIPFYRSKEIIEKSKGNDVSTELYISKERFNELKNKFGAPSLGDILLTSVGTLGVPYIVRKEEFYFKDGNLTWIKNFKDNCHNKFIFYWLLSPDGVSQINTRCIGSTQKALTIDTLKKFELKIPPFEEQKAITQILSTLDDKIEVNNQINKTLENMAQAIFKQWFVDFEFPNEDGEPYKSSGGEMIESDLGLMPKGWKVKSFEDAFYFQEGPGIRNWQYVEKGTKFINIRCIQDNDLYLETANMISCEEADGKYKHFMIDSGDMVMSTSGTLGRYAIVREEHLPLCLNTSVIRFKPLDGQEHYSYMYAYLTSNEFLNHLITKASGSVQKNFGPMHLRQIKLLYPNASIIKLLNAIISPIIKSSLHTKKENDKLKELRDTLLPKLMSGEIRVPLDEECDAS